MSEEGRVQESDRPFSLSHDRIWAAIDALAVAHGMSPSRLAKRAGLDATTFNRSKRQTAGGRLRWPSTESIAKILNATGANVEDFLKMGSIWRAPASARLPAISLDHANQPGFFDESGNPSGDGWAQTDFSDILGEVSYAVTVSNDALVPVFRAGDILFISLRAPIRRKDRIVLMTNNAEVLLGEVSDRTQEAIELCAFGSAPTVQTFRSGEIAWIGRIIWSSH